MVYNDVLKREIPEGWLLKSIKDFCDVITGKEDANFSNDTGLFAFFTCGDNILKCNKPAFEGKSILVAGNGNFNVKYYEGLFNAYQRTYVLIPEKSIYIGIMHRSLLNSIERFSKNANGSIVKFITKGDIENTPVIIPHKVEFLEPFNMYLSEMHHIKQENSELKKIRDFLLPMLMNGQVSIID
jgi:type I restriction enzyme S subunit